MRTYFFSFQKVVNGQPMPIYLEICVRESVSRRQARKIAEQEIDEYREGLQLLREKIQSTARNVRAFPVTDYRFVGAN